MPKPLADNPLMFPGPVIVPVDGDAANGAVFEVPYQALTNRTAYLQRIVDVLGVARVRRAESIADLKAAVGFAPLEVRVVPGAGLFWFDTAGTDPEDIPYVVVPLFASGRWRNFEPDTRSRVASATHITGTISVGGAGTTFIDVPGMSVTIPNGRAGDRMIVHFHGSLVSTIGPSGFRLVYNDGSVGAAINEAAVNVPASSSPGSETFRAWDALRTVGADGAVTVRLQARNTSFGSAGVVAPACLLVELHR
jgi:hypothetical protein